MTSRQQKQPRKGVQDSAPRRPAWTGARGSPTYSPSVQNARLPTGPQSASTASFPPLAPTNGPPRVDRPIDRVLQQLSGLTGTTITLSTKTNQRYEGSVLSTGGEGDTTGVTLKDVKELTQPGAPLKDQLFIASTNIDTWASGPADAKIPTTNGLDTFKTDTDISQKAPLKRERELQAWQPTSPEDASHPPTLPTGAPPNHTDDMTFGPGSAHGNNSWDQFAVNEKLFGVKAGFDEDVYTTKLDRSAPDFREKEKKAQALANEILGAATNNVHVAEERVMNFTGEAGANEEEKYGAVVRGANAYVPPGARKTGSAAPAGAAITKEGSVPSSSPTPTGTNPDIPKVSINAPDGSSVAPSTSGTGTSQITSSATSPSVATAGGKPGADPIPAFRSFVSSEKDRLMRKKQALMKNEMDKRMAELVKFSKSFKLNKPIPDDLVPILAKDEEKQRLIKEKSSKDAESSHARVIGPLNTLSSPAAANTNTIGASASAAVRLNQPATPASAKPPAAIPEIAKQQGTSAAKGVSGGSAKAGSSASGNNSSVSAVKPGAGKSGRISMFIQPIPPFKARGHSSAQDSTGASSGNSGASGTGKSGPAKTQTLPPISHSHVAGGSSSSSGNGNGVPMSPTTANRLNVNASSFRPTNRNMTPPGSANASPKPKPSDATPTQNSFFGNRPIKKGPAVHIKDDFNPFKQSKPVDASAVVATWPYSGKRYMTMFPLPPSQPQQQSPHLAPPGPPPMPPPSYEEDSAAQAAAARGYVYAYPPYPYPGQPMMPGMAPPPPGAYIPGPFMQPIPYPHMPPPSAMYPTTPMGQMPPPQAYMSAPPPGTYPPPPNGAGPRPSMPPTPIPSHAHPYYHQSPQLQHAVPYQMMMPPPGAPGVPHPYDGSQAPPVQMGGVGHA